MYVKREPSDLFLDPSIRFLHKALEGNIQKEFYASKGDSTTRTVQAMMQHYKMLPNHIAMGCPWHLGLISGWTTYVCVS